MFHKILRSLELAHLADWIAKYVGIREIAGPLVSGVLTAIWAWAEKRPALDVIVIGLVTAVAVLLLLLLIKKLLTRPGIRTSAVAAEPATGVSAPPIVAGSSASAPREYYEPLIQVAERAFGNAQGSQARALYEREGGDRDEQIDLMMEQLWQKGIVLFGRPAKAADLEKIQHSFATHRIRRLDGGAILVSNLNTEPLFYDLSVTRADAERFAPRAPS